MGDFGTVIQIKSSSTLSNQVVDDIKESIRVIFVENEYDQLETYSLSYDEYTVNTNKDVVLFFLTDHYYSGDSIEDEDLKEFILEFEIPIAESIIEELKLKYQDFSFDAFVEDW